MKKLMLMFLLAGLLLIGSAGCTVQVTNVNTADSSDSRNENRSTSYTQDLSGHSLQIYCDEDLQAPLTEITAAFEQSSGVSAGITFGTAGQLSGLIYSRFEGDVFIAASESELGTLSTDGFVAASRPLVTRLPVLAVPDGNPGRVTNLKALSRKQICLADTRSDLIGKISLSILADNDIDASSDNITYVSSHDALLDTLSAGEADAAIVWSELASDVPGVQILHSADLGDYAQTVPAISLSTCADQDALAAYLDYLTSDSAKKIWKSHHYNMAG